MIGRYRMEWDGKRSLMQLESLHLDVLFVLRLYFCFSVTKELGKIGEYLLHIENSLQSYALIIYPNNCKFLSIYQTNINPFCLCLQCSYIYRRTVVNGNKRVQINYLC